MIRTLRAPEGPHSKFGASSAHRWGSCPGSMAMTLGREDSGSIYATEGTAAHALAAECLNTGEPASEYAGVTVEVERGGEIALVEVDDEMVSSVQAYLDLVDQWAEGGALLVEAQVDYASLIGAPQGQGFGTADAIIVGNEGNLIVIDFKYGRGEAVSAEDNEQLLLYAAGARAMVEDLGYRVRGMTAVICQPRVFDEPSVWSIDDAKADAMLAELRSSVALSVEAEQLEVRRSPAKMAGYLKPSAKACRWCRAKATCPALAAFVKANTSGLWAVDLEFNTQEVLDAFAELDESPAVKSPEDVVMPTEDTSLEALGAFLKNAPLIEDWLKAVRSEAERRALAGEKIPGFKLVKGRQGNRTWKDPNEVEAMLKKYRLKIEDMYDLKLISPTTAEKLAKNKVLGPRQWKALQENIIRSEGSVSLAPEDDKRDAVVVLPVADQFSDLV